LQTNTVATPEKHLYILSVAMGVAVWLLPWLLLGGKEAWDHGSYFGISVPAMVAVAAYAAYRAKSRWWRWPLTLVLAQFAAALLLGGFGSLFPLGIIVFLILGVPMFIAAAIGAWIAKRRGQNDN
jgi:hypothetical protein